MRLFALDLHISVIADLRDILKNHEIIEWSLSGHNWVFGRSPEKTEVITQYSWQNLTPVQLEEFREKYDSFLRTFDGFLVGHVMPYTMLFEPYGKPIFAWNTCRYDLPFCFTKDQTHLGTYNDALRRMIESGQLSICANNLADQSYFKHGTGLTIPRIPSLCRYTGMHYSPQKPGFFWYSTTMSSPESTLIIPRTGVFQWSELALYKGIIHIPYEISTMSLYEHYQSGIPMFLPTKRFLKQLWQSGEAHWQSVSAYWGSQLPDYLKDCESIDFWIEKADFYDSENMKYLYYFDSISDLLQILSTFDDIYYKERLDWIASRESRVLAYWETQLAKISSEKKGT